MISEDIILPKDRAECLLATLAEVLSIKSLECVKIRITADKVVLVPLCKALEMKR